MILSREPRYELKTRWHRGQMQAVGTNRRLKMLVDKADFWDAFWAHPLRTIWQLLRTGN